MPRPIWTGSISFGLVNVPIKLFSATESHRVAFHELEEGTGERVRYKRVAEGSGHEVAWEKIQKGFEVGKDRFVVLTDDELEAAAPARTHTVDIEQFVSMTEIDPVAWDQTYYAAPDGVAATKAYVLLRDAMRKDGRSPWDASSCARRSRSSACGRSRTRSRCTRCSSPTRCAT